MKPPVAEVILSLQFGSLPSLTTAHVGLLWQKYRERLPLVEEHPPLFPALEHFGPPSPPRVEVAFDEEPPAPRVWFMNEARTEHVRVQQECLGELAVNQCEVTYVKHIARAGGWERRSSLRGARPTGARAGS